MPSISVKPYARARFGHDMDLARVPEDVGIPGQRDTVWRELLGHVCRHLVGGRFGHAVRHVADPLPGRPVRQVDDQPPLPFDHRSPDELTGTIVCPHAGREHGIPAPERLLPEWSAPAIRAHPPEHRLHLGVVPMVASEPRHPVVVAVVLGRCRSARDEDSGAMARQLSCDAGSEAFGPPVTIASIPRSRFGFVSIAAHCTGDQTRCLRHR